MNARVDPVRRAAHITLLVLLSPALLLVLVFGGLLVSAGYVGRFFALAWRREDRSVLVPASPIAATHVVGSRPAR